MTKYVPLLATLAIASAACGSEDSTPLNRKAPQILFFEANPEIADRSEPVTVSWDTANADRIAVSEIVEGATEGVVIYESTLELVGALEYRAHRNVTLALTAYNTRGGADPVTAQAVVTVAPSPSDHILAFYPEHVNVLPGGSVNLLYSLVSIPAGWGIVVGEIGGSQLLATDFAADESYIEGEIPGDPIETHTGYYIELQDTEGMVAEYAETAVFVTPAAPPSILEFSVDDEEITVGDTTTLRWNVVNATQVSVDPGVATSFCTAGVCEGNEVVAPTFTQDFSITATGIGGVIVARLTIVVAGAPVPPTVDEFNSTPGEIRPGTGALLSWETTDAATVDIEGVPADATLPSSFALDGSATVSPAVTTVYTITAINTSGTDIDSTIVTVTPLASGDLVITEIMVDPDVVLDTNAEWFELHNPGTMEANLRGLTIESGVASDTIDTDVIVDAGGYALLALSANSALNDNLPSPDFVYSGIAFNATGDLSVHNGATLIDEVAWDGTWSFSSGAALSLDSVFTLATQNDVFVNWCDASIGWTGAVDNFGSPGQPNPTCP